MQFDQTFISQTLSSALVQGIIPKNINFCVDSRQIQQGDIFVALSGARVDGHNFIGDALAQGASGFILNKKYQAALIQKYEKDFEQKCIIWVDDPEQALIDLACAWRQKFQIPVIGITGSVGKTTTKEMVKTILQHAKIASLVSAGNQNTLIGASINILKMTDQHQVAVFEMGIGETGKMKQLAQLVRPTHAVITMIGHGHMQGLGSVEQIAREKRDIFSLFNERNIGIINGDQKELADISYKHPVIRFGKKITNQVQARKIVVQNNSVHCLIQIYKKRYSVVLQTPNQSRVMNALAAISIGKVLNIADEILIEAVQNFRSTDRRFQLIPLQKYQCELIDDAYNANPESMKASLLAFDQYQTSRKRVLILGDMLELADKSIFYHKNLGRMVAKLSDIHAVILIGQHVLNTAKILPRHIKQYHFKDTDSAVELLKNMLLDQNTIFLFKASRSMGFISLVKQLQAL